MYIRVNIEYVCVDVLNNVTKSYKECSASLYMHNYSNECRYFIHS